VNYIAAPESRKSIAPGIKTLCCRPWHASSHCFVNAVNAQVVSEYHRQPSISLIVLLINHSNTASRYVSSFALIP